MRRWVCIVALLAGFATGPGPRPQPRRPPVAVERLLDEGRLGASLAGDPLRRTIAWWRPL